MSFASCISVGSYSQGLTRGHKYPVLEKDEEKRQIKIKGDNQKVRWYPSYCFDLSGADVISLQEIIIEDELSEGLKGAIEVTIILSNKESRWCFFMIPQALEAYGKFIDGTILRLHYSCLHMIVVPSISRDIINQALHYMDSQGELIRCTIALEKPDCS